MKYSRIDDLLKTEIDLNDTLTRFGLQKTKNRFSDAYGVLRRVHTNHKTGIPQSKDDLRLRPFAIQDVSELSKILDIKISKSDMPTFRGKFIRLIKGTLDRKRESTDSDARDIQFELVLLADLKKAGIDAQLGINHPDIELRCSGRKYGVEAKRLYSDNRRAVERNTERAASQISSFYLTNDNTRRGLVALALERYYNKGERFLQSKSEKDARIFLRNQIEDFVKSNDRLWNDIKVMKDPRIWVLVYLTTTAVLDDEEAYAHATHVTFTNGIDSPRLKQFKRDLTRDVIMPITTNLLNDNN